MGLNWAYDFNVIIRGKFDISLDTDDIVDFSSFSKGKEILKNTKLKFNIID